MKKKIIIVLSIIMVLIMLFALSGCNRIRSGKDYYLYTYDWSLGNYVKNTAKISIKGDAYTRYDNDGMVVDVGEYLTYNNTVTFIPDKIGDNSPMNNTVSLYFYKEFLVPMFGLISRVTDVPQDRGGFEGIYSNNRKYKSGIIYRSEDGSGVEESYTQRVGTYKFNRNRDFVNLYYDDGNSEMLLCFEYIDALGYKVNALTNIFFSYKNPGTRSLQETDVELKTKIFVNNSGGEATHNLSLFSYPDKKQVKGDVKYTILGDAGTASIEGSNLKFNGTGWLDIEYEYKNIKGIERVYIVSFKTKSNLSDADRTYAINTEKSAFEFVNAFADYDAHGFAYFTVSSSNSEVAEVKNGKLSCKKAGTAVITMTVRYVYNYFDGTKDFVLITDTVTIIVS